MKVYITKYALTKGIIESEGEILGGPTKMLRTTINSYRVNFYGTEWHQNKNEAIYKAEEMRKKKIASLEKQIEKLKKLKFI
ncbi:hypothetical protein ACVVIH_20565 [Chryseobacterium arthrosphaerae]|uniref:hypothetical protein n=1 Tax=Chryseobacterium arthrosphaerae TaxID=651561 RepID=UPI003D345FB6